MSDEIERDYERGITRACQAGDSDAAHHLSVGLAEYRAMFKVDPTDRATTIGRTEA